MNKEVFYMDIEKALKIKIKEIILDELKEFPSIALMNKGNITIVTNEGLYYSNLDLNDSLLRYIIDKIIVYCLEILIIYKSLYNKKEEDYVPVSDKPIKNKYIKKLYKSKQTKKISTEGYEAMLRIETNFEKFDSLYKSDRKHLTLEISGLKYNLSDFREDVDYPFYSETFVLNEVVLNYLSMNLNKGNLRKKYYAPANAEDYVFFLFDKFLDKQTPLFSRCEEIINSYKLPKANEMDNFSKNFIYVNSVLPRFANSITNDFYKKLEKEANTVSEYEKNLWKIFLQQIGDIVLFYPVHEEDNYSLIGHSTLFNTDLEKEVSEIKKYINDSGKNINRGFSMINKLYNEYIGDYNIILESYNEKSDKEKLVVNYILFNSLLHNRFFKSLKSSTVYNKILMETDLKRVYNFASINELDTMILKRDIFNIDFLKMLMLFDIDLNEMEQKSYIIDKGPKSICSRVDMLYLNFNLRGESTYDQYTNDLVYKLIYKILCRVFCGELNTLLKDILDDASISIKELVELYYDTNTSTFEPVDNHCYNIDYHMDELDLKPNSDFIKSNSYINDFIISFLLFSNCYNRKFNGNTFIKRGGA